MTEVMNWMGDLGGTRWFTGQIPVTLIKPCSKWAMIKMMKGFLSFSKNAVSKTSNEVIG